MIINPYKHGSRGAKALQNALKAIGEKAFVIQREPRQQDVLIFNWGNSEFDYPVGRYPFIVNPPHSVGDMTNKRRFFQRVGHTDLVPKWTSDPQMAFKWGTKVMARMVLEGSGGKGIIVWDPEIMKGNPASFPMNAPLYTQYENKTHEFRIHMGRAFKTGSEFAPFLIQRKIFQKTEERPVPLDWNVRNHANGFVYVRESGYPTPKTVIETAKAFLEEHFHTLHFVALDIVYNEKKDRAWVLEGNTAPGLEGQTIQNYVEYFKMIQNEVKSA